MNLFTIMDIVINLCQEPRSKKQVQQVQCIPTLNANSKKFDHAC
jgi:hypothetical protein